MPFLSETEANKMLQMMEEKVEGDDDAGHAASHAWYIFAPAMGIYDFRKEIKYPCSNKKKSEHAWCNQSFQTHERCSLVLLHVVQCLEPDSEQMRDPDRRAERACLHRCTCLPTRMTSPRLHVQFVRPPYWYSSSRSNRPGVTESFCPSVKKKVFVLKKLSISFIRFIMESIMVEHFNVFS
jgi:hypothetical protein